MLARNRFTLLVGLFLLLSAAYLLASCAPKAVAPVQVVQTQAKVDTVEVMQQIGGQGELLALVRGALPDGCAELGEPVVTPGGRLVVVILPQIRAQNAQGCLPGPLPFERTVSLGKNLAPGQYTVSVNGVQALFDLQGEPTAAPTQAAVAQNAAAQNAPAQNEPTALPPTPAATAEPLPTVTPTAAPTLEPTPTAAVQQPQPAPTQAPLTSAGCEDKAAFFADVSVPDGMLFNPGDKFTKTWRIRNMGSCTWQGYSLAFQDGDRLGSSDPAPIVKAVAPGQDVEISLQMIAPQAPGGYFSDWLFVNSQGTMFGLGNPPVGLLWTKIGVRSQTPPGGPGPVCAFTSDASVEAQILALINQARQERSLPPLKLVDGLSTAARGHAEDMACNDFVEHYGSDGSTWYTRIQAQGVRYKDASENIYAGNPQFGGTALGAFTWWMNSQVHRDNILNPKSKQIGIGYVFYDGSTYKGYYTLNFVQP